jgi:uncharacterized protein (TIGR02145 family)
MASELSMNGRKKIETLQKEFTQKFPYLTLVFLDKERRAIDISKSLSEVRQAKGADISIIASLKVNTLEKRFLENFGLVVEVAYQKSDKIVYTKDNVDKTLNELNKWCQENDCQPFEFKKSLTGNTLSSVQEQLFEAIKEYYPNAEAKKINKDNYLDIHIPEINKKRGTHLFFNTAKDGIKIGFYCRDEDFVEEVLSNSSNIEKYSQGIRILNNPIQNDVEEATTSALSFIEEITGEQKSNSVENLEGSLISTFTEQFDLNDFLGYNLTERPGKMSVYEILSSQMELAIKNNELDFEFEYIGSVDLNDWDGLSLLIGKEESLENKKEYSQENISQSGNINFLYCGGTYVYSVSNPGDGDDNESNLDDDLDKILRDLGYEEEDTNEQDAESSNIQVPDANFKNYLISNKEINPNGNKEILLSEAAAFTGDIDCSGLNIADLTGIEAFTALDTLKCDNNKLSSLDLSSNTALTYLHCGNNKLSSLDVSASTGLIYLFCESNELSNLDISSNASLRILRCSNNQLSSLDLSANAALVDLNCDNNQLTSLDLSANPHLYELNCCDNELESLDLSANPVLNFLSCMNNYFDSDALMSQYNEEEDDDFEEEDDDFEDEDEDEEDEIDLDEMLREMEDGDDEGKEDEEDNEISDELVDALFNSTKSKDNQSLMLDKNTIPQILKEINADKNLKHIQITYYINNYSDLYFGLVYKVNNCNVEVNRVNWYNDSYWTGEIEREQLIEGLTEYHNGQINGLELFDEYIHADDWKFDRAGTLDNGVEFSITDLNNLTDIPKNLQDEDGELDVWELSNYLGSEEEDLYDENIGRTFSYEFSLNGKTYGLIIDRSNEEKIDEEEMAEDEAESSDKASLFFPINANTTIVYDEVFEMNEGMIKVKKDDLFGFLDKEGNEIVPCNYVFASDFKDGVCYLVSNNEDDETVFDYINYKNEKYFSLKNYSSGKAPNKYGAWVQKEDTSKWEFYDIKGNLVHTADYDNVSKFKEGYSWCTKDKTTFLLSISGETKKIIAFNYEVCNDLNNGLVAISVDEKYGFYKFSGTSITKFIYDSYKLNLSNGYISVSIDEKWGVINSDGLVVVPCIYDDIEDGNNDLFIVTLDDKKGVVDITGNIIIEIQYDDINGFEDGYAIIELNELYGIINLKGQEIVSCISSEWPSIPKSKLVGIYTENGCNLIDLKTGNPVLKGNYDAVLADGNNLLVSVNDKWGWIDNKENVIIKFKFDRAFSFVDSDLARVHVDEKFGFIDKTGNFKIKPIYADLEPFDGNYAIASLDGESYGLIDKNGNQIVEFKYSSIEYDTEGFFKLTPIDLDNADFYGEKGYEEDEEEYDDIEEEYIEGDENDDFEDEEEDDDFEEEEDDDQILTVSIGTQRWATLNLDVDTFRNGDPIPHAESDEDWIIAGANKQPAWCFSNNDPSNGEKYGKLYNWYAVNDPRGLAPAGYHVPNETEWDTLDAHLGVSGAINMRKENGWKDGQSGNYTWVVNCQNTSGFSGLPGGLRTGDGKFSTDKSGFWWSRTESNADSAFYCCLYNDNDILNRRNDRKFFGFSVRCIKN